MKGYLRVLALALVLVMAFASIVFADPVSRPAGPWVQDEQELSFSSFMTNEELYETLEKMAGRSKGRMKLEIAGYSNAPYYDIMEEAGYPLYVAKFGEADPEKTRVLITTQIHGNEPLGTEAVVDLMQKFTSNDKEVLDILENVTVWFMPRINPDGAMNEYEGQWYPVRYTHQTWDPTELGLPEGTTAPWYYNTGRERAQNNKGYVSYGIPGYDQNRDYNADLDFRIEDLVNAGRTQEMADFLNNRRYNSSRYGGFFVTPEARAVAKVFKELEPDVYFDIHHRGFNRLSDEDDRSVPIQIAAVVAAPYTEPFSGKHYEVPEEVLTLAKKINVVGHDSIQRGFSHFGAIQRYPNVDLPGTSLGAFALNGAAIMLIEVKGQTQTLGQKQGGMLIQTVKVPVYEILKSLADGSIHDVDASLYDQIPKSSNSISPNPPK